MAENDKEIIELLPLGQRKITLKKLKINMREKIKPILVVLVLLIVSCSGQRSTTSYSECMEKHFQPTGNDFYGNLKMIENKLLEIGALSSKTREGYLNTFQALLNEDNDEEWKGYYLALNKTVLKEFDLEIYKAQFLSFCSNIDLDKDKIECNSTNVQKYFFKQLTYKSYNDNEVLDGLFLFTDFNINSLRQNMTYLLLLNLEEKYGNG